MTLQWICCDIENPSREERHSCLPRRWADLYGHWEFVSSLMGYKSPALGDSGGVAASGDVIGTLLLDVGTVTGDKPDSKDRTGCFFWCVGHNRYTLFRCNKQGSRRGSNSNLCWNVIMSANWTLKSLNCYRIHWCETKNKHKTKAAWKHPLL